MANHLPRLPHRGSARESVLVDYYFRRDEISYARDLANAQLAIDQAKGVKRFEEFQNVLFPWLKTARARVRAENSAIVRKVADIGPLVVQSMVPEGRATAVSYLQRGKPK